MIPQQACFFKKTKVLSPKSLFLTCFFGESLFPKSLFLTKKSFFPQKLVSNKSFFSPKTAVSKKTLFPRTLFVPCLMFVSKQKAYSHQKLVSNKASSPKACSPKSQFQKKKKTKMFLKQASSPHSLFKIKQRFFPKKRFSNLFFFGKVCSPKACF